MLPLYLHGRVGVHGPPPSSEQVVRDVGEEHLGLGGDARPPPVLWGHWYVTDPVQTRQSQAARDGQAGRCRSVGRRAVRTSQRSSVNSVRTSGASASVRTSVQSASVHLSVGMVVGMVSRRGQNVSRYGQNVSLHGNVNREQTVAETPVGMVRTSSNIRLQPPPCVPPEQIDGQ